MHHVKCMYKVYYSPYIRFDKQVAIFVGFIANEHTNFTTIYILK
jgi:hypothetical protein